MKHALTKTALSLTIATVFMLAFVQAPASCKIYFNKQETAKAFLANVVEVDFTEYETVLLSEHEPLTNEDITSLLHNLKSKEITLDVMCSFRNRDLVSCVMYPLNGSPDFTHSKTDTLDFTKRFIDRYQNWSEASYIQPLREMLNNATEFKPQSITSNSVRLSIIMKDCDYVEWMEAPNGIHNMHNRLGLVFQNGTLHSFSDSWNRYPIGNADVTFSKEQAISIARERSKSYSYNTNPAVTNLTVNEESDWTNAELTMQPRGSVLYPQWEVNLPLDRVYPGMVTSIRVRIWADTGDIDYIHETSVGGVIQDGNPNPTATATETPPPQASNLTQTEKETTTNQYAIPEIVAGAGIVAIVIAIVTAKIKKRNSKNSDRP